MGLVGKKNKADEGLVSAIRGVNMVNPLQLYITDARPFAAAVGNKMAGAGSCFLFFSLSLILSEITLSSAFSLLPLSLVSFFFLLQDMRNIQIANSNFWTFQIFTQCVLLSPN